MYSNACNMCTEAAETLAGNISATRLSRNFVPLKGFGAFLQAKERGSPNLLFDFLLMGIF